MTSAACSTYRPTRPFPPLDVQIESSVGAVIKGQSTSTAATLTARVRRGGAEITDDLDAACFAWTRVSADTAGDAAWNAAHAGAKTAIVTAAEFAAGAAKYDCTVTEAVE